MIKLFLTAVAFFALHHTPTLAQVLSAQQDATKLHTGYISGKWIAPLGAQASTGVAITQNVIRCTPLHIFGTITIDQLSVNILTATPASNAQLALYTNGPNARAYTELAKTASIDTSTTGLKSTSVTSVQVPRGVYWVCINTSLTGLTASAMAQQAVGIIPGLIGVDAPNDVINGAVVAQTFGTWGDLSGASWVQAADEKTPRIFARIASVP